jgi:RNA polymerase sigma-70 factor, ECF subfamily
MIRRSRGVRSVGAEVARGEMNNNFETEALPYLDAVYRFALRLTGSPEEAHDLTQEAFLKAYEAWHQYTPGTRCKSWLFTITRNVFLRQGLRHKRFEEIVARGAWEEGTVNPLWATVESVDPEGEFFTSLVDGTVLRAVDQLPEEYRTTIMLSDVEGLSYAEIGRLMDVPAGTVKSRLFRARRRLQKELFDYAVEMGHLRPPVKENV